LAVLLVFAPAFVATVGDRNNRFPGMLAALLVYFAYSNLLGLSAALVSRAAAGPAALWGVHGVFLVAALYFLRRRHLSQPLWPRPWRKATPA